MSFLIIFIYAVIIFAVVIAIFAWLYERSSRETAIVRTGLGGRKIIMDGGIVVLPYFHKIDKVNMKTIRLEVKRSEREALITKDRLRVDVVVEFYISVEPTETAIARASQTLGQNTYNADSIKELIEGKLIDSLLANAAQNTMDELHEDRAGFVGKIKSSLKNEIEKNGLQLESVSLTSLDQTTFSSLDENNAFNAVGMKKLAEVIASSKKDRAAIDADAEVSVKRSEMEATKQTLSINLEEKEAEIEQERQLEVIKAEQIANIAETKAKSEISTNKSKIEMEEAIRNADIERLENIKKSEIQQKLNVETAEQERHIQILKQSQNELKAEVEANLVKAEAAKSEEEITTRRAVASAERSKSLDVISAQKESEVSGLKKIKEAETEAKTKIMQAEAEISATKSNVEAEKLRLSILAQELNVKATGKKALNEAENTLSDELINLRKDENKLNAIPKIVEQMVKPAEKIGSIKIHHITGGGLSRNNQINADGKSSTEKPAVNQALDSIMDMAVQLPALKKIGEELGVSLEDGITGVTGSTEKNDKNEK